MSWILKDCPKCKGNGTLEILDIQDDFLTYMCKNCLHLEKFENDGEW